MTFAIQSEDWLCLLRLEYSHDLKDNLSLEEWINLAGERPSL